jgi:hypothetical protein
VLYQLSYAPRFEVGKCIRGLLGHTRPVTDQGFDEQTHPEQDDLLEEQEGKGYGEDEGERDESLPEDESSS